MKRERIRFVFLFASMLSGLFFITDTQAQTGPDVKGVVRDQTTRMPLEGATIRIYNAQDSLLQSTSSDALGRFSFSVQSIGTYQAKIQFLGYKERQLKFNIPEGHEEITLTALLENSSIQLEGVEITAAPTVVLKGDTTEFNAAAFTTEPYADSDALLAQLPGFEIDAEGNLIAQGEQITRIIVDGREFFSTDPRIAMKNLPADIIDKIQLIDERSDQARFTGFDDGERNKIVNIVTRRDRRNGYFGRVGSAYGNLDRYNLGGNLNIFGGARRMSFNAVSNNVNQQNFGMGDGNISVGVGGGLGGRGGRGGRVGRGRRMNAGGGGFGGGGMATGIPGNTRTTSLSTSFNDSWLDETFEFSGDYSFNKTSSLVHSLTNQETLIGNNANQFSQTESESDRDNQSHRINMRVEWEIDTMQELNFRPNFSFQRTDNMQRYISATAFTHDEPINASNRDQTNENRNFNLSGDLSYRLRLAKPGRTLSLTAVANMNSNKGLAQTVSLNQYYEDYLLGRTDTVNNRNNTEGLGNGITGRLNYTEPINEFNRLMFNYSLRDNSNYSNRETLDYLAETGQFSELNRQLSNTFNNDYLYHSGGISYQFSRESFNVDVGLDFQGSDIKNHKTFPDEELLTHGFQSYLPNASVSYRPSRNLRFQFNYTTRTNAPSINQLQDVINNENPLNIRTGNPNLNQEYSHGFSMSFNSVKPERGGSLNVSLNADFSNNRVVNSTFIATADTMIAPGIILGNGGQFTRPVNVDGYYTMRGNVSFGIPIPNWKLNLNLNTGLHHNHDIGLMNLQRTYSDSYGVNQTIGVHSRISQRLVFGASYSGNYRIVNNSLNANENYNYFNQNIRGDFTWIFWKGVRVNSSVAYNKNTGLSQGYDQSFILWNASLGKKLFKREQAELTLSAYDLLNKNVNIVRTVDEMYITDSSSNTLQQYFMLSFTYNLRHFGSGFAGMRSRFE